MNTTEQDKRLAELMGWEYRACLTCIRGCPALPASGLPCSLCNFPSWHDPQGEEYYDPPAYSTDRALWALILEGLVRDGWHFSVGRDAGELGFFVTNDDYSFELDAHCESVGEAVVAAEIARLEREAAK